MGWKTWTVTIGLGMLALAVVGLLLHADLRLVDADIIGAFVALAVILMGGRRGAGFLAARVLALVALLVIAILSVTAHAAPWLTALTLTGAFALAFMTLVSMSRTRASDTAGRPQPT
jgi:hypothetical protein